MGIRWQRTQVPTTAKLVTEFNMSAPAECGATDGENGSTATRVVVATGYPVGMVQTCPEGRMHNLDPLHYPRIVLFTGVGLANDGEELLVDPDGSEERLGLKAFRADPEKVLRHYERRREAALRCRLPTGYTLISELQRAHPQITIVTQCVDGLHQRAGHRNVIELHGSLWRLRCDVHGVIEDQGTPRYAQHQCLQCGDWLRPDVSWFGDRFDKAVLGQAAGMIQHCDLFIAIGISAYSWPGALLVALARNSLCVEINPEPSELSEWFSIVHRERPGIGLSQLLKNDLRVPVAQADCNSGMSDTNGSATFCSLLA